MEQNPLGLTQAEADTLLERHGPNSLGDVKRRSPFALLFRQFTGLLVLILIGAAVIAAVLGEVVDAVTIGLVVVLNGILGFVQEWHAENALAALRSMLSAEARVIRGGRERRIDTVDLVPGDLVLLGTGDRVPADMRLTADAELRIDESAMTGESFAVHKVTGEDGDVGLVFMGTAVVSGHAEGIVSATGRGTRFGEIAALTSETVSKKTHMEEVLGRLSRQMAMAAAAVAVLIIAVGIWAGHDIEEMFLTALSLAVAIVPEGLPAVVTITLALGAATMVRQKALARRLQAVETLGAATVICTDKTGTLTEDKMTATEVILPRQKFRVTGGGYDPAGHIEGPDGTRLRRADDKGLDALLDSARICNHARVLRDDNGSWHLSGSPTEGALVTLAMKGWSPEPNPGAVIGEAPFTSERKRMSVLAAGREGGWILHVKGAPEIVLARSTQVIAAGGEVPLDEAGRADLVRAYEAAASEGRRIIAVARKSLPGPEMPGDETDLTFLGFVALMDPPRSEVASALKAAKTAGLRVIMITGDGAATAAAVALAIGLEVGQVVTGPMLEDMDDEALLEVLKAPVLFARTKPAHKMRIVTALQSMGEIVAMTGDGVNDAPALKQADIGVAMGVRGTDVARDASALVLLDDNFATIVGAVGEGRRQFDNLRKFVRYLLSSNAGEIVALVANILIGGPLIFLATQILWMNLVTDGVTAVALGMERGSPGIMKRPPRKASEGVVGGAGLLMILAFGAYTGTASLWLFYHLLPLIGETGARTAAFTAMVVFEKLSVFAFRSFTDATSRIGWFSNRLLIIALILTLGAQLAAVYWPPLQLLLRTEAFGLDVWKMIGLLAAPLVIVPEAIKLLRRG